MPSPAQRLQLPTKGSPATSIRAFGIFSVIGCNRVARPPARMAPGIDRYRSLSDHLGSFEIEAETHFLQSSLCSWRAEAASCHRRRTSGSRHRPRRSACRRSRRSLIARSRTIRRFAGCTCRPSASSCAPSVRASTRPKPTRLPVFESFLTAKPKIFDVMQVVNIAVSLPCVRVSWSARMLPRPTAGESGKEQQQIILEIKERRHASTQAALLRPSHPDGR